MICLWITVTFLLHFKRFRYHRYIKKTNYYGIWVPSWQQRDTISCNINDVYEANTTKQTHHPLLVYPLPFWKLELENETRGRLKTLVQNDELKVIVEAYEALPLIRYHQNSWVQLENIQDTRAGVGSSPSSAVVTRTCANRLF